MASYLEKLLINITPYSLCQECSYSVYHTLLLVTGKKGCGSITDTYTDAFFDIMFSQVVDQPCYYSVGNGVSSPTVKLFHFRVDDFHPFTPIVGI